MSLPDDNFVNRPDIDRSEMVMNIFRPIAEYKDQYYEGNQFKPENIISVREENGFLKVKVSTNVSAQGIETLLETFQTIWRLFDETYMGVLITYQED